MIDDCYLFQSTNMINYVSRPYFNYVTIVMVDENKNVIGYMIFNPVTEIWEYVKHD